MANQLPAVRHIWLLLRVRCCAVCSHHVKVQVVCEQKEGMPGGAGEVKKATHVRKSSHGQGASQCFIAAADKDRASAAPSSPCNKQKLPSKS